MGIQLLWWLHHILIKSVKHFKTIVFLFETQSQSVLNLLWIIIAVCRFASISFFCPCHPMFYFIQAYLQWGTCCICPLHFLAAIISYIWVTNERRRLIIADCTTDYNYFNNCIFLFVAFSFYPSLAFFYKYIFVGSIKLAKLSRNAKNKK